MTESFSLTLGASVGLACESGLAFAHSPACVRYGPVIRRFYCWLIIKSQFKQGNIPNCLSGHF